MNTYKRHWFPPDIISYTVWLYYRFNLSHRDIDDLLAEREYRQGNLFLLEKWKIRATKKDIQGRKWGMLALY